MSRTNELHLFSPCASLPIPVGGGDWRSTARVSDGAGGVAAAGVVRVTTAAAAVVALLAARILDALLLFPWRLVRHFPAISRSEGDNNKLRFDMTYQDQFQDQLDITGRG